MNYEKWRKSALDYAGKSPSISKVVDDFIARSKETEKPDSEWFSASCKDIRQSSGAGRTTVVNTIWALKFSNLLLVNSGRDNKGAANQYRLTLGETNR